MHVLDEYGGVVAGAFACLAVWAGGWPPSASASSVVLPAYYNPGDANFDAPLIFLRQAPPPTNNSENKNNYAYGPLTDSSSQDVTDQNKSTWTGGHEWPFLWVNRARVPAGQVLIPANPIYPAILNPQGAQYRTEFTTVDRADAATKAEVLYIMGASPSVWQAPLTAAGVTAIAWDTLEDNPTAYFTNKSQDGGSMVTLDKMVIPTTVSTSAYGFILDYEVQDDRPPDVAHDFLDGLGATIRSYGLKAYLYTNPWDDENSYGIQANGFEFSRIDDIKANFDYISLLVWCGQNQCNEPLSYPQSVDFLKGISGKLNFKQIIVTVDLYNCSPGEAAVIADQQEIDHFAGYNIWNDGAIDGGSTLTGSNLVIWKLLYPDGD